MSKFLMQIWSDHVVMNSFVIFFLFLHFIWTVIYTSIDFLEEPWVWDYGYQYVLIILSLTCGFVFIGMLYRENLE